MATSSQEGGSGPSPESSEKNANVAIVVSRKFLLTDIPLLNDLSQVLQEVVSQMPDMKAKLRLMEYSIGDFRLSCIDHDKTGLEFGDSFHNGFQIVVSFYGLEVTANKLQVKIAGVLPVKAPLIDVSVKIKSLVILINFFLQDKNDIEFSLAENGINLPSLQVSAEKKILNTVNHVVRPVLPHLPKMLNISDRVIHDIMDKLNPWFERLFIKDLGEAIENKSSNIVPNCMDHISINAGDGKINSSVLFNELLLDDKYLRLKALCKWGAHVDGKPDLLPQALTHPNKALNEAELDDDVNALIDTSLANQFLQAIWYVTPASSKEESEEIPFATALESLLQHLPRWKPKEEEEKLVAFAKATCEPPTLKASAAKGLFTNLKITATLTYDTEDDKDGNGSHKTVFTVFRANVDATSELVGPTFDPEKSTFSFSLKNLEINKFVVTDDRNSKMSKWLTSFLDQLLVNRHKKELAFSEWWEQKGSFVDKAKSAVASFGEYLMDRIREKVDAQINAGLQEANDMIDEEICQFVLPTTDFFVVGHHIHVKANNISVDTDDDLIKIMTEVDFADQKAADQKAAEMTTDKKS